VQEVKLEEESKEEKQPEEKNFTTLFKQK